MRTHKSPCIKPKGNSTTKHSGNFFGMPGTHSVSVKMARRGGEDSVDLASPAVAVCGLPALGAAGNVDGLGVNEFDDRLPGNRIEAES